MRLISNPISFHKIIIVILFAIFLLGFSLGLVILTTETVYRFAHGKWYFLDKKGKYSSKIKNGADSFDLYRSSFPIQKENERVRILAIGGSTTFGFGLPIPLTWPALLDEMLEERFPGRYRVVNLGRLGGHLEEFIQNYSASLDEYVPREEWIHASPSRIAEVPRAQWGWRDTLPEEIILAPVINDTAPDYLDSFHLTVVGRWASSLRGWCTHIRWCNQWAAGFYFKRAMWVFESKSQSLPPDKTERLTLIRNSYRHNLERFLKLWDKHIQIHLIGLPFVFNSEDGKNEASRAGRYWNINSSKSLMKEVDYLPKLETLEAEVRNLVASRRGLLHKELGQDIKKRSFGKRLSYYLDSIHLNGKGNALIAKEIMDSFFVGQSAP